MDMFMLYASTVKLFIVLAQEHGDPPGSLDTKEARTW